MKFIMRNRSGDNKKVVFGLFAVIMILIIVSGVSLKLYLDTQNKFRDLSLSSIIPTPSAQDIKDMVERLGRHMVLPAETPKMITIANADVLKKTQPFFAKAQNGHKLLVFKEKVILYDPISDKIIDIAAIRLNPPTTYNLQPTTHNLPPTPTITSKYKVLLLNGTNIQNLSQKIEPTITQFKEIEITSKAFAKNSDYTGNILVDVKKSDSSLASTLAQALDATIAPLPAGENEPPKNIDFILILGQQ